MAINNAMESAFMQNFRLSMVVELVKAQYAAAPRGLMTDDDVNQMFANAEKAAMVFTVRYNVENAQAAS